MHFMSKVVNSNNNYLKIGDPIHYLKVEGGGHSVFLLLLHIVLKNRVEGLIVSLEIVCSFFDKYCTDYIRRFLKHADFKVLSQIDYNLAETYPDL